MGTFAGRRAARPLALAAGCAFALTLAACAPSLPLLGMGVDAPATTPAPAPTWRYTWLAAPPVDASLQAAFAASAWAQSPKGALSPPTATYWLATGQRFALVLMQLDPADRSLALAVLATDPTYGPGWSSLTALSMARPARGGNPSNPVAGELTLPGSDYVCGSSNFTVGPQVLMRLCTSPDQVFVMGRFTLAATRPTAGATAVRVAGLAGWLTQQGSVSSIVVPLADGTTFVCAGSASPARLEAIAAQALPDLDRYLA
ncbi:MAG TPA: hypothetical protein VGN32_11280 [Ktedonobacterales bacterium]|jgi:hypothetical protein|nr:hypothetical protein [Ktedonobacterales bacterium]